MAAVIDTADSPRGPLEMLGALAKVHGDIDGDSRVVEVYTMEGLLRIWWWGQPGAADVVVMAGGAMGGILGPGRALFIELAKSMAASGGAAMAIDYRRPGDIGACLLDLCAATDLAVRNGGRRFCLLGHSFGGAVAIQAAGTFPAHTVGVITYATQSAGCEEAARMGDVPLLLLHGENDSILGPENSRMVQSLAGHGEVLTFPGADHLLTEAADEIAGISRSWIDARFADEGD